MDKNMQEILGLKRMHDMDPNCQRLDSGIMAKLLAMKKKGEADEIRVLQDKTSLKIMYFWTGYAYFDRLLNCRIPQWKR